MEELNNSVWTHKYLSYLQSRWMLMVTQCDMMKNFDNCKTDNIDNDLRNLTEETREFLWTALPFVSGVNKANLGWTKQPDEGMNIESLWLKAWFCFHLIEKDILKSCFNDPLRSPLNIITLCREMSIFVLHILHRIKSIHTKRPVIFSYSNEGATQALFFVLAEYSHSFCKVPREIPIYDTLRRLWEMEGVLYLSRSPHRDHIFHSIDISLLGLLLLNTQTANGRNLDENIAESHFQGDRQKVIGNWLLASLFHDIGYTFTLYEATGKMIDFFDAESIKGSSAVINKTIAEANDAIMEDAKERFRELSGLDPQASFGHGIVSAVHLHFLLNKISAGNKAIVEKFYPAVNAILAHDVKEYEVSCDTHPIAFLLLLCDHLQDWGRPRLDTIKARRSVAAHLDYPQPLEIDAFRNMAYLSLNIAMKNEGGHKQIGYAEPILKFTLVYKHNKSNNFEPAMLWVDTTIDLQRAINPNLWDGIDFNIITPVQKTLEIDFIRDFIAEDRSGPALTNWLAAVKSPENDFIDYFPPVDRPAEKRPFESFLIRIRKSERNRGAFKWFFSVFNDDKTKENPKVSKPEGLYSTYVLWKTKKLEMLQLGKNKYHSDIDLRELK